jgi:hypothetical protein
VEPDVSVPPNLYEARREPEFVTVRLPLVASPMAMSPREMTLLVLLSVISTVPEAADVPRTPPWLAGAVVPAVRLVVWPAGIVTEEESLGEVLLRIVAGARL